MTKMTSKSSFQNPYSDYNDDIGQNILSESKEGVSNLFSKKLQSFKESKLHFLTTTMEQDVFYDGTVYTGSAGLALFYLICGLNKKEDCHKPFQVTLVGMDGMVEENGTAGGAGMQDPLAGSETSTAPTHVVATSIVQLTLPAQAPSAQVQSVIQPNQQSVIQTASNIQPVQLPKGNVILVSKPSSVIHTTQATLQTLQIKPEPNSVVNTQGQSCSDESCSDDESPKRKYREMLTRRPSYRKILNDLGGAEIADNRMGCKPGCENEVPLSSPLSFAPVIPAGALQTDSGLHTLAVSSAPGGGAIVQYANQDGQFYVPGPILEDQTRKRELRLLKNREAARECRRKKKEYIKCLENRVAVLENQNKALIEELKSLKELYCQQKTE